MNMKRSIYTLLLAMAAICAYAQSNTIVPGQAYYILNKYYNKPLSHGDDAGTPRLSAMATNPADSYVFDCVASATDGYFYLQQRSSGLWFAATKASNNTWGTVLTSTKDNDALWSCGDGSLTCKKNTGKRLGVDTGKESDKYVGVYYDKDANDRSVWRFIKVVDGGYEASLKAADAEDAEYEAMKQNTQVLLTGSTLGLGGSYTVGIQDISFAKDECATILLRNTAGKGVSLELHADHVALQGKSYSYSPQEKTSLLLTSNNGTVAVRCNGEVLASVAATTLAALTDAGTDCELSIMNASALASYMPVIYSSTKAVDEGTYETDKQGHKVLKVVCMNNVKSMVAADDVDVHLLSSEPFKGSCKVNIEGDRSRLIFDSCRPSAVKGMMSNVRINGSAANAGSNCCLAIYLNGAVVFAKPQHPFVGYYGEQYSGEEIALSSTGNTNLNKRANEMQSFILRRGYMATLAANDGQGGYTRVYVADHEDLLVPVLPDALNRRVSSVHVKQWQYVSKRGWCSDGRATANSSVANDIRRLNATWFYNWSANWYTNDDWEYIPIRQHLYWPSLTDIKNHGSATACLLFNEPEHSEQHTSSQCTCGGAINAWNACTKTPDMSNMGMRVGSPAPTDMSWLYEYTGHVDDMAYRCDFVAIHAYWGTNEMANAEAWKNMLTEIYNKTHRPIWITEWNNGASWTNEWWPSSYSDRIEKNRKAIKEIVAVLESLDFVERYAIYNWDGGMPRYVINPDDGWVTPAGQEYRDAPSNFAYNAKVQRVPNWWAPGLKDISMTTKTQDGNTTFTIKNPNGDMTATLCVERQKADGSWEEIHSFTERYLFDSNEQTVTLPVGGDALYRARLTTLKGATTTTSYIANPDCNNGTDGWTVSRVDTKSGEAADGDKANTYWDHWEATPYTSTMKQTLTGMPDGKYALTAQLRGQSHVVMTLALESGSNKSETEFKGTDTQKAEGSPYVMGWQDVTTAEVDCTDGTLTISLKAVNPSGAGWWSADHFTLTYTPEGEVGIAGSKAVEEDAQVYDLSGRMVGKQHRGIVIRNGKKVLRR